MEQQGTILTVDWGREPHIQCLGCNRLKKIQLPYLPLGWRVVNKTIDDPNGSAEVEGYICSDTCGAKYFLNKAGKWNRHVRIRSRTRREQLLLITDHADETLEQGFSYLRAISARYRGEEKSADFHFYFLHEVLTVITQVQEVLHSGKISKHYLEKWHKFVRETLEQGIQLD